MKRIYLNPGQQFNYYIAARNEYVVAARGFGKSTGIIALRIIRNFLHMPRSSGALIGKSYKLLLKNILPGIVAALEKWGYKNKVHFYVGRKAPDNAGFAMPYIEPLDWEYCIHFFNGTVIYLISQEIKFGSNGQNFDWVIIDEAKTIDYQKFKSETAPAIRGFRGHFQGCPWHRSILAVTDMPTTKQSQWIRQKVHEMDKNLINYIIAIQNRIANIKAAIKDKEPSQWHKNELSRLRKELAWARTNATLYTEYDAIDNIEVLGLDYIEDQRRILSPLEFATSIMNMPILQIDDGFYPALNADVHYYNVSSTSHLNSLRAADGTINTDETGSNDCEQDDDIRADLPLLLAFDYNNNINWLVVGQADYQKNVLHVIRSFYVKTPYKLRELIAEFSRYYATHTNRDVVYYYDPTALQGGYAVENVTYVDYVQDYLSDNNWNCSPAFIDRIWKHIAKHEVIHKALIGEKYLGIRINNDNNQALCIALETTGIKRGINGFEKDKRAEKLAETPENQTQYRTDGTDAFDLLVIGANYLPYQNSLGIGVIY